MTDSTALSHDPFGLQLESFNYSRSYNGGLYRYNCLQDILTLVLLVAGEGQIGCWGNAILMVVSSKSRASGDQMAIRDRMAEIW